MGYWGREQVEIGRDELHRQVWEEPVSKIAPKYGISDVGLKKICVKLGVPVPPRGYWAKLANGKSPRKKTLPKIKKGELESVKIDKRPPRSPSAGEGSAGSTPNGWTHERISAGELQMITHPVLAKLKEDYSTAVLGDDGLLHSRRKDAESFRVGPSNRDRALWMLQSLFTAFEREGYEVAASAGQYECKTPSGTVRFRSCPSAWCRSLRS